MQPIEEWRPVPGFENMYEVSSAGRVRSLDRVVQRTSAPQTIHGRTMVGSLMASGHVSVSLRNAGASQFKYVHRLVYETFVGPIPDGMEVRHMNGVPNDNRLENLAVGTRRDQRLDDVRNGIHPQARKTHCKRGHPLDAPFLDPARLQRGQRICNPCKRATMLRKYYGLDEAGIQLLADKKYQEMLSAL